jgi:hypothetical protein
LGLWARSRRAAAKYHSLLFHAPVSLLSTPCWPPGSPPSRPEVCSPAILNLVEFFRYLLPDSGAPKIWNFGAREKLTGFARQNLPTDLASSRDLMQGSDFRFRSCCPRANHNGYAHLDEDNSFAAHQKSGADDIAVSTPCAAHTPKTPRNAVLRGGNSIRAQMGNFWRAPRFGTRGQE